MTPPIKSTAAKQALTSWGTPATTPEPDVIGEAFYVWIARLNDVLNSREPSLPMTTNERLRHRWIADTVEEMRELWELLDHKARERLAVQQARLNAALKGRRQNACLEPRQIQEIKQSRGLPSIRAAMIEHLKAQKKDPDDHLEQLHNRYYGHLKNCSFCRPASVVTSRRATSATEPREARSAHAAEGPRTPHHRRGSRSTRR
jgi:hypothetical protein